uniref:Uncharacterized protein n=1 Tax=Marseillevirus sp. TaxID=2809551 RepID=A0AA96IY78_9VIRU|nr:hypothetical protein MarFTMF_405 [Marseillevirus sp.]
MNKLENFVLSLTSLGIISDGEWKILVSEFIMSINYPLQILPVLENKRLFSGCFKKDI